jgi:hypothetical protein
MKIFKTQNAKCKTQNAERKTQNAKRKTQNAKRRCFAFIVFQGKWFES